MSEWWADSPGVGCQPGRPSRWADDLQQRHWTAVRAGWGLAACFPGRRPTFHRVSILGSVSGPCSVRAVCCWGVCWRARAHQACCPAASRGAVSAGRRHRPPHCSRLHWVWGTVRCGHGSLVLDLPLLFILFFFPFCLEYHFAPFRQVKRIRT